MASTRVTVFQINVSLGGVPKTAVPRARITTHGVEGDQQRTRSVHGGPDRAVCVYSLECVNALRREGHPIQPGSTGENLTIEGLDWPHVKPGDRLRIGKDVELELMSYTTPCRANAGSFLAGDFHRISQTRHPGWSRLYARVLREGIVSPGDEVRHTIRLPRREEVHS